ncbi:MAG: carboxypeptidase-like regulatory domain-containing protein [Planctomycetota bacterium]
MRRSPRLAWAVTALLAVAAVAIVGLDRVPRRAESIEPVKESGEVAAVGDAEDLVSPEAAIGERRTPVSPTVDDAPPTVEAPVPALPEDARLVVRVLDSSGSPVEDVAVEWVVVHATYGVNEQSIDGTTDELGRLVPEHADRLLGARFGAGGGPWMLSALGLRGTLPFNEYEPRDGPDPQGVLWLEDEPAMGEVIDIVLPPSGSVRFEWDPLLAGDGSPVLENYHLHIRRADGDYFPGWRTGFTVPAGAAHHDFGPVGLGWEVYGSLTHPDLLGTLGTVRAAGPTQPGQAVTLRIPRADDQSDLVRLHGIATDATGTAMTATRTKVSLGDPDVRGTPGKGALTGDDGTWSFLVARATLDAHLGAEANPGLVTLSARRDGDVHRGTATFARADLEGEEVALGPIALVPPVPEGPEPILIAEGRVLDQAGEPIRRAYVSVEGRCAVRGTEVVEQPSEWTTLDSTRTDGEGRYVLREAVELTDGVVRVTAGHRDYLSVDPVEVAVGRDDVDFQLTRGLAVALKIDIEPWAAIADAVSLRFSGNGVSRSPSLMDFAGHYEERFSGLEAGNYRLEVRMRGGEWVLFEKEIDVQGDLDLGVVDLKGRFATCHLEITDETGAPLDQRYVRIVDAATGRTVDRSARIGDAGVCHVIVPNDIDGIRVIASDGRFAEVPASAFTVPTRGVVPPRLAVTVQR